MKIELSSHRQNELVAQAKAKIELIEKELNAIKEEQAYKAKIAKNEEPQDNFFQKQRTNRTSLDPNQRRYGNKGERNTKDEMKNSFFKRLNDYNNRNK